LSKRCPQNVPKWPGLSGILIFSRSPLAMDLPGGGVDRRGAVDELDFMAFLVCAGVDRKKYLPLYKGPAGERIGRVLGKSARNYFWGSRLARFFKLDGTPEPDPVRGFDMEREDDFRYGLGDGRVVWLECGNGLPRSGGAGSPVEFRAGIRVLNL
jgi:hypothetical protein